MLWLRLSVEHLQKSISNGNNYKKGCVGCWTWSVGDWYLPFGGKGSAVWWACPVAFPLRAAVGVEVCVSSGAAEALICGRSKMSRTEKLDVRGILISSNLEGEVTEISHILNFI